MAQFVDLQILELESNAAGFRVAFRSLATRISLHLFYFKSLEAYDFVSIFVCRYIYTHIAVQVKKKNKSLMLCKALFIWSRIQ